MRYLLDTHTLLWFLQGNKQLAKETREIENVENKCYTSIASAWEIAIKTKLGKLELEFPFEKLAEYLFFNDIKLLPISFEHLQRLMTIDVIHKDPFDRIIVAQALYEDLTIISKDENFAGYGIKLLW